jgi:hypothetical protein
MDLRRIDWRGAPTHLVLLDTGWSCEKAAGALLLDDDTIRQEAMVASVRRRRPTRRHDARRLGLEIEVFYPFHLAVMLRSRTVPEIVVTSKLCTAVFAADGNTKAAATETAGSNNQSHQFISPRHVNEGHIPDLVGVAAIDIYEPCQVPGALEGAIGVVAIPTFSGSHPTLCALAVPSDNHEKMANAIVINLISAAADRILSPRVSR